jgi:DNA adenine methylase
MLYSPLRYPGGKNKLSKFVSNICLENGINGTYVEPYAGGASVALYLLIEKHVSKIIINDIDRSIYAFWHSVLNETEKLCSLIEKTDISISNWIKFRGIQKNKENENLIDLGLSTFFLNRTNFSGVIDAGVIGGLRQDGKYKMNCRFNKENLISRIKLIAEYKERIELFNLDALELIKKVEKKSSKKSTIYYFDPPYFLKGPSLYMSFYKSNDHKKVSEQIKKIKNAHWIVSYDNVQEIREMYSNLNSTEYLLSYTANGKKKGKEVLFFSPNLSIPKMNII